MFFIKRITSIFLIFLLLSSCGSVPLAFKPASWIFKRVPDGPLIYQKGWRDGCETGLSTMTNGFYKTFYDFKQDPALRSNPSYYKIWKDSATFCRHYAYGIIRSANVRLKLANERTSALSSIFGTENILEHGLLSIGPGSEGGIFLENVGIVGGDTSIDTMNGVWDFRGEAAFFGDINNTMDWDFRPKNSIAPYYTDIDAFK